MLVLALSVLVGGDGFHRSFPTPERKAVFAGSPSLLYNYDGFMAVYTGSLPLTCPSENNCLGGTPTHHPFSGLQPHTKHMALNGKGIL